MVEIWLTYNDDFQWKVEIFLGVRGGPVSIQDAEQPQAFIVLPETDLFIRRSVSTPYQIEKIQDEFMEAINNKNLEKVKELIKDVDLNKENKEQYSINFISIKYK